MRFLEKRMSTKNNGRGMNGSGKEQRKRACCHYTHTRRGREKTRFVQSNPKSWMMKEPLLPNLIWSFFPFPFVPLPTPETKLPPSSSPFLPLPKSPFACVQAFITPPSSSGGGLQGRGRWKEQQLSRARDDRRGIFLFWDRILTMFRTRISFPATCKKPTSL